MTTTHERGLDRAALEEMLPWHAAGTLGRAEAETVEQALARDPELARRYELVREEHLETIHLNESLGAPSARALDRVMAAMTQDAVARDPRAASRRGPAAVLSRIAAVLDVLSPRAVAWAGAAAAVVILVQAGLIAGLAVGERGGAVLEMASYDAPAGSAAPAAGAFALVRFVPQATAADIARVLEARGATIVDGPKPGGLYRVRVAGEALTDDDFARLLATWQAETAVVGFVAKAQ
ncbi:hypothetical protein [Rhodoplanes serenus]|uniref:hypothetical protein n=1 Tax=Rhodoplanes serenus TaxID=200615 RepID=UPI000DAD3B42|nr:hypothetical protein [Rhodoplanes serenus]RAI34078.1 hypothetical protein CH340_10225 [Rhodoplanes serenus]